MPQALAGKDVPAHMRAKFPDLISTTTGKFKREFVRSLDTKEAAAAKKQAHRIVLKLAMVFEAAEAVLAVPGPSSQPATINPKEIGAAVYGKNRAAPSAAYPSRM
ncbi:hypothetical protein GRB70_16580 [Bradyrhizobium neotropicale]|nr:hypothetical protein [Bradyrhizobium neotropicale]